jgi:hypothetical protein
MRRRSPWLWTWALVLLASMGALAVQDGFAHTDDGCDVEIHCLACRWAFHRSIAPSGLPAPLPGLLPLGSAPLPPPLAVVKAQADATGTRGPPSLS